MKHTTVPSGTNFASDEECCLKDHHNLKGFFKVCPNHYHLIKIIPTYIIYGENSIVHISQWEFWKFYLK